jgi:hypothetical protein
MMARRDVLASEPDDAILLLDGASRWLAAATSTRRAELELHGAAAFTAITQVLIELRADTRIVDLSARAIAEELRHSEIYLSLARSYAIGDVPAPRPSPIDVPRFPTVGVDGERLLQVLGMCSINETMACAFLELCLSRATASRVRSGLREILEDEIRHAPGAGNVSASTSAAIVCPTARPRLEPGTTARRSAFRR